MSSSHHAPTRRPASSAPRARRSRSLAVTATVLALGLTSACTSTSSETGSSSALDRLRESGTVTVGFAGEAPYSYEDGGELTGATVALHREIFAELGIETVEGVNTEFGSLIPGLTASRFDAVSAGMSILPDRCEQAAFSEPEFMYTTALLVPEGNPAGLTDMQSVQDAGIKLATMSGAIEGDYARALGLDHLEVGTPQDGLDAVVAGRADAFALTGISLNNLAEGTSAPVEVTESFVAEIDGVPQIGAGGTVFRTNDTELLEAYNEKLAEIVADEERYLGIVGEYGFTAAERPVDGLTTEALCGGDLDKVAQDLAAELGLEG
ncbi:ectoine/hydroxyectoine ABC transporter substrate-binding protein EhuB [Oerskovia turbata]|uniref:Ectoine/hydroxyectoine ABC transporter substrate-binding protein EhuB n=1 Tax=Oerskovia turbata TaxID=1713 RepID=A0A4Q1KRR0_9CELL|nr:ectoine/hydroxyectoine ABC transporter substrate-binding protein EhuB [Oerskovia turbata]RXR22693.1 ectoine/hydroxyectoine ABC transporter substrate-binding protein EhuB [Oerskovia turbata]RXR32029.1 ectoine/hydroxyectoine ABC transporter substrate-binding protein EhuB [Oerskovia turbata]TGJ96087.1 ectoine/hydroxyectoine ABC transporter substrate-binding protein EhuB [Actinotalea fermentans ATCC 43279 = JCM 9966 = DSM 3133]